MVVADIMSFVLERQEPFYLAGTSSVQYTESSTRQIKQRLLCALRVSNESRLEGRVGGDNGLA
jgi:hypothetical protein